jgi:hypothetical protein
MAQTLRVEARVSKRALVDLELNLLQKGKLYHWFGQEVRKSVSFTIATAEGEILVQRGGKN